MIPIVKAPSVEWIKKGILYRRIIRQAILEGKAISPAFIKEVRTKLDYFYAL